MAFSFSNWFKKSSVPEDAAAATTTTPPAAPPGPAPAAPRFPSAPPAPGTTPAPTRAGTLKTVVPNSVRPTNLREGAGRLSVTPTAAPTPASLRPGPSALRPAIQPISLPGMVPIPPAAAPAAPAPPAKAAAAPVLNPAPDAPVTVTLGEFIDRVPTNLLRPGATVDRGREVVFKAADLYSDLTRGRASVPVSAVQAACPDLFGRPVSPTEDVEIALPLQRVIEQLVGTFQARPDQVAEEDVAEIETPFLQAALEDSVRLPKPPAPPAPLRPVVAATPSSKTPATAGSEAATVRALTPRQTPAAPHAPAQASSTPSPNPLVPGARDNGAPINPATKRPPSTVRASVAGGKIRLSGPAISSRSIAPAAANSTPAPLAPSAPPAAVRPVILPPASLSAAAAASAPAQKKTARIQIPPISLRPAGTPAAPTGAPRPPAAGTPARSVPFPEPLVSFRAKPGESHGAGPAPIAMPPPPTTPGIVLRPAGGPAPGRPAFTPTPPPPPIMSFAPVALPPPGPVAPAPAPTAAEDGAKIAFALAPILRTLPDEMFAGDLTAYPAAEQVPDDAKVELPLGFITAQLAQGRVAVPRAMFVAAMPAECRHLMPVEGEPAEVLIPLQEVFQNLPTGALSRRHDQVVETIGPEIPTPFSQKAQEDAQRLAAEPEPEPEPVAVLEAPELPAVLDPEPEALADAETVVVAETPAGVVAEPTVEVAVPDPAPVVEAPAVVVEETPEVTPEPVEAKVEEPAAAPIEEATPPVVEEAEAAFVTPAASEVEETPAATEVEAEPVEAEPVVAEHAEGLEAPASVIVEAPLEVTEPADKPADAPVEHAPPETLELPLRDLPPAAVVVPEAPPAPMLPAANGHHSPAPADSPEAAQDALRAIFMVDEDLDAKKVLRLAANLPGLRACVVMFGDGLKLAGNLEDGLSVGEGFCAMTPPFFRRVRAYATELELGETQYVSLQTERALLSFFMAGDICLGVQHAGNRPFLPGVREKLLAATTELSRMYATPVAR